jgi:hypothetical protein
MARVLINYSRDIYTDSELLTEVLSIEKGLTGNSDFATPSPTIIAIADARDKFQKALAKALNGTPTDTSDKNDKRLIIEKMLHTLGAYVQLTSGSVESKILSTGMHVWGKRGIIGEFAIVNNFKAFTQEASNKVLCSCEAMDKAGFYEVLYTASPATATSVWISETSTRHSIEIEDLPSFIPYVFKMAARGASKKKNFSNPITRAAN